MTEPEVDAGSRWRPHRAGIRNIWEYDDQEFAFADGRLILRGPNGSGKSNALALVFPFLIDGTMSAAAMDPFAGGRSMKSLLLGVLRDDERGRFRHDQRLGYVWMEFRRTVGSAATEYLTIGCGARARAQGDTRAWYFLTARRVGVDLDLAPDATPLPRGRLREELGIEQVFDTAEAYRVALDRAMFAMGEDRLGKLVGLIRVLRRPQLAGKLNLDLLSEVLSAGLPAIDANALDDVASSFDDLERTQADLADLRATRATVDAFLPTYLAYLRGEALRRVTAVSAARRSADRADRDQADAISEVRRVDDALADHAVQAKANDDERSRLDARRAALVESPAYRSANELREVGRQADQAESAADAALTRRNQAAERAERARNEAGERRAASKQAVAAADRSLQLVLDLADAIDASWTLQVDEHHQPDRLRAAIDTVQRERRGEAHQVREAIASRDQAQDAHRGAEGRASDALEAADAAAAAAALARDEEAARRKELVAAVQSWLTAISVLEAPASAAMLAAAETAGTTEAPLLVELFRSLTTSRRDALITDRTRAEARISDLQTEAGQVEAQRAAVAGEVDAAPAAPPWRTADRGARPGAALWSACDFTEGALTSDDRAGLEVALEAAGLLDAWISPPGARSAATDPTDGDTDAWLRADPQRATGSEDTGPTLDELLTPFVTADSGLTEADVRGVLASISLGQVGIAVDTAGHFSLGPLHGRAAKARPEFIGAPARAERRRRRLEELDRRLDDLAAQVDTEAGAVERCDTELASIEEAAATLPTLDAIEQARAVVSEVEARVVVERRNADRAASEEQSAAAELAERVLDLRRTAARCRIDATSDAVAELVDHLDRFTSAGQLAIGARESAITAAERADEAENRAQEADRDAQDRADEHGRAQQDASSARERYDTLERAVGADASQAVADLAGIDERQRSLRSAGQELTERRSQLDQELGAARSRVDEAADAISRAAQVLAARSARLPVLRRKDLLDLVVETPEEVVDLPTEPVAFARWLADRLPGPTPDEEAQRRAVGALDRAQRPLIDDLHRGYDASISHDDDLVTVQITSETGTFGLSVLADQLRRQEEQLSEYLTEGDRRVFERFLLDRVSHDLRRLLIEADEFVAGVNRALATTRTASGLRVELTWALATDDAGVPDAVRLLRHDTDQMGDDDRATLRAFFDRAIRQARAADPDGGYRVALERALDYRAWHDFCPYLRTADGSRARLTRTQFRGLSGGEQAVALHLPLFAAASAHYARARPSAPRLVALDEAFAGIDEAMRGELMALTVAFDLDVILTGHELWGAYAEVPSIAVHDLLRRPPAEGVSVFSLRWDGVGLVEPEPDPGVDSVPDRPLAGEGLFADPAATTSLDDGDDP